MTTLHHWPQVAASAPQGLPKYPAGLETEPSLGEIHAVLRDELIDALMADPQRKLTEPRFKHAEPLTAAEVIDDQIAGRPETLRELLRIVALAASGQADHELHLRASAWIAARGKEHADFYAAQALELQ